MANKDILISAIDQFIIDYPAYPLGGLPFISTIMIGHTHQDLSYQAGILETLPANITFTDQDFVDVANYFVEKYPDYLEHTYQDWYSGLVQFLSTGIVTPGEPALPLVPGVTPTPPTEATSLLKPILIFGGVLLLIILLGHGK